jgi:hypothetical protein
MVWFVVRKTISELEHVILTTLFLLAQKTPTWVMCKLIFTAPFYGACRAQLLCLLVCYTMGL